MVDVFSMFARERRVRRGVAAAEGLPDLNIIQSAS